jgi:3-hydroxyisobutyrate dehydrogenase-like beta-hydroxyacid dehydrogenase
VRTATTRIPLGFIGLGHMGGNMAARLLAAGYVVHGTGRTRARARWLLDRGLRWRDTPREVAEAATVVFTSLPDDATLDAVASGPDGILAALGPHQVWVDTSTVGPRTSRRLTARVRARGAAMLDAPVFGTAPQAQAGTLAIMVGGDPHVYRRVAPILRAIGTPARVGVNGHALVLKLAIAISLAAQVLALAEAVLLAERNGIPRRLAVDVLARSTVGSPALHARGPLLVDAPHGAWNSIQLIRGDIGLALAAGRDLGVPLPSAALAGTVLTAAGALGYDRCDIAALVQVLGLQQQRTRRPGATEPPGT